MAPDFFFAWQLPSGLLIENSALIALARGAKLKQKSPDTTLVPGVKAVPPRCTCTPSKPPSPGTCCRSMLLQSATTVQLPALYTVATQCTVPSGLHDRVTSVTERLQISQVPGVRVAVGGAGVLVAPTGVLLGVLLGV